MPPEQTPETDNDRNERQGRVAALAGKLATVHAHVNIVASGVVEKLGMANPAPGVSPRAVVLGAAAAAGIALVHPDLMPSAVEIVNPASGAALPAVSPEAALQSIPRNAA